MKSSSFLSTDYTEKLMFTYTKNRVNPCNPCLNYKMRFDLTDLTRISTKTPPRASTSSSGSCGYGAHRSKCG